MSQTHGATNRGDRLCRFAYGALMLYDDVIADAFQPTPDGSVAAPTQDASPARRLRDAVEPLAMHSVWSRHVNEATAALGLDFMTNYVWGRASLLGVPEPGLVVSSFAVFSPDLLVPVYEAGRAAVDRDTIVATRTQATIESLAGVLGDADVAPVADALRTALGAADSIARPLFAGLSSLPWPDEPLGQLWRACELFREHRGDSHNVVLVMRNLDPIQANIVTELWLGMPLFSYSATRGWTPEQLETTAATLRAQGWIDGESLSDWGREARDMIEEITDGLQHAIIDALGTDLDAIVDQLSVWSTACIDAAAFPPNIFKRAAG